MNSLSELPPDELEADDLAPGDLAKACADAMWDADNASRALGMEIVEISAGRATLTMTVRDDMTNGQKICHGGFVFLLADSAFAFACNSYNQFTVAQNCSIDFITPARQGEQLTATAVERHRTGRSGLYDVTVTNQDDAVVAEFRGISRTVKGSHIPVG